MTRVRGESQPVDLDEIEMRWANQWNESDDGEVRAWRDDVAALIDECRRLHHVSNRYFEEMVRRTPGSAAPSPALTREALVAALRDRYSWMDWPEGVYERDAQLILDYLDIGTPPPTSTREET